MPIANRVRAVRVRRGMSQTKLSFLVGAGSGLVSAVERGTREAYPKLRRKIAEVLEVQEDYLFPENKRRDTASGDCDAH